MICSLTRDIQYYESSEKAYSLIQWFDALVSFVFNIGGGNFRKSALLKKANANPYENSIMDEFMQWVYSKGVVILDLQKR
jgi:hypothetical protein